VVVGVPGRERDHGAGCEAVTPLEQEILRRNALLRAWREVGGVPVVGGWQWTHDPCFHGYYPVYSRDPRETGCLYYVLTCLDCERGTYSHILSHNHRRRPRRSMNYREREATILAFCEHLEPLLGPLPPEVLAFAELTLMESTL
jgi:hypothetical protein